MKKLLLTGAALVATFFSAQAQQILTSFEEAESLGYTAGSDIGDYSGLWGTYNTTTQADVESGVIVISADWASDGAQSLYFPGQFVGNNDVNFALTAPLTFSSLALPFTISFDVQTTSIDTQLGSNFYTDIASYDSAAQASHYIGSIAFDYSDVIKGYNPADTTQVYQGPAFVAGTSNRISYRFNADSTFTYLVDGNEIGTYTPDASFLNGVYFIDFGADDYGTDWYVDNITIDGTLGTKNLLASKLSVYPNPASDVVNVGNADNVLINGISIADINGRVVKTAKFEGVASAQVNISDLATGIYMMTVSSDKGTTTKKIVKN